MKRPGFVLVSLFKFCFIIAQPSGAGQFSNYMIDCHDGGSSPDCFSSGDSMDTFYYRVPYDGDLMITAYALNGIVNCCLEPDTLVCTGYIRQDDGTTLHTIRNSRDEYIIPCVAQGEEFIFFFQGRLGEYGYTTQVFEPTHGSDTEDNNVISSSSILEVDNTYGGRINYGYYNRDAIDYYRLLFSDNGDYEIFIIADTILSAKLRNENDHVIENYLSDTIVIALQCVNKEDELYISINGFNGLCASYKIQFRMTRIPNYEDYEPNDDVTEALPFLPELKGNVGYGNGLNKDRQDYYYLGDLVVGDVIRYCHSAANGSVTVGVFRLSDNIPISIKSQSLYRGECLEVIINHIAPYVVRISSLKCVDYKLSFSGCLSRIHLNGYISDGEVVAKQAIVLRDIILDGHTLLNAPEISFSKNTIVKDSLRIESVGCK